MLPSTVAMRGALTALACPQASAFVPTAAPGHTRRYLRNLATGEIPLELNATQCTDPFAVCPGETAPPVPPAEVNFCLENFCRITAPPSPPSPLPPPSPPLPTPPPCEHECITAPHAAASLSPAPPPTPAGGLGAIGWIAILALLAGGWVLGRRYRRGLLAPRRLLTGQANSSSTIQASLAAPANADRMCSVGAAAVGTRPQHATPLGRSILPLTPHHDVAPSLRRCISSTTARAGASVTRDAPRRARRKPTSLRRAS